MKKLRLITVLLGLSAIALMTMSFTFSDIKTQFATDLSLGPVRPDLKVSAIAGMPVGREPIGTTAVDEGHDADLAIDSAVAKHVAQGRQAFVVCPLVSASEAIDAIAAAVYGPTPGRLSRSFSREGKTPPNSSTTCRAQA